MNDYERLRNRKLFIVEGNHEKNKLLKILFGCYNELEIDFDDVVIYETNIYQLYKDIEEVYSEEWDEQDIDLPFIVGKKKNMSNLIKYNFTNILIIFDYERHDPEFSEEKITKMQNYFTDITDVGQLYINYPMIESYQDFTIIPDGDFINKIISVKTQPGKKYKHLVKDNPVKKLININKKLHDILSERFSLTDEDICCECVEEILKLTLDEELKDRIESILIDKLSIKYLETAKRQIEDVLIRNCNTQNKDQTYYTFMRMIFDYIIRENIKKALKIQGESSEVFAELNRDSFLSLNLKHILIKQNEFSRDVENGFIWILNTCIFLVPAYSFELIN